MVIIRTWLALAVLCAGTARGGGPSYSAANIVNASSFVAGPFAPNSVVTIIGGNGLARSPHALVDSDLIACPSPPAGRRPPTGVDYIPVYLPGQPAPPPF